MARHSLDAARLLAVFKGLKLVILQRERMSSHTGRTLAAFGDCMDFMMWIHPTAKRKDFNVHEREESDKAQGEVLVEGHIARYGYEG